jgi:hypothetical protein
MRASWGDSRRTSNLDRLNDWCIVGYKEFHVQMMLKNIVSGSWWGETWRDITPGPPDIATSRFGPACRWKCDRYAVSVTDHNPRTTVGLPMTSYYSHQFMYQITVG